jgi:hypothetical protein
MILDQHGHALDARGEPMTDPYGHLSWTIGDGNDFWCFDAARLTDGRVVVHAVVNSETGSFIMDAAYEIVPASDALRAAQGVVDQAWEWVYDNMPEVDGTDYTDSMKADREFLAYVTRLASQP